jgi:hypothetical protein
VHSLTADRKLKKLKTAKLSTSKNLKTRSEQKTAQIRTELILEITM